MFVHVTIDVSSANKQNVASKFKSTVDTKLYRQNQMNSYAGELISPSRYWQYRESEF